MRSAPSLRLCALLASGLLACGQSDILVTLANVPSRAAAVTVTAALDGSAAMSPLELTPPVERFGISLQSGKSGRLAVDVQAFDSDRCTQGTGHGELTAPTGPRGELPISMAAQSPRKCGSLPPCAANTACSITKPATRDIRRIWAVSPTDVWAVGDGAKILHFDGTGWSVVPPPSGVGEDLYGLWGSGPSDLWAVGIFGRILHYDGSAWSVKQSPTTNSLYGIWGISKSEVFAVGASPSPGGMPGTFLEYDGSNWKSVTPEGLDTFNSVWATRSSGSLFIYACGNNGLLVRYDESLVQPWAEVNSNVTVHLYDIWGTPSRTVFAVGNTGAILRIRYTDATPSWRAVPSGTTNYLARVRGEGDVLYAVGASGLVLRSEAPFDTFTAQSSSTGSNLLGVSFASNGLVWLGGQGGYLGFLDQRP